MLNSQKTAPAENVYPLPEGASEGLYRPLVVTLLVFSWT